MLILEPEAGTWGMDNYISQYSVGSNHLSITKISVSVSKIYIIRTHQLSHVSSEVFKGSCIFSLVLFHIIPRGGGGGTPYVMGDTYVPRFWPPFFTLAGSSTIFLGYFSHPPTAKLTFGVQKLPIFFTKIDLFGPKFNFFLDLFGSNFQRPAAHPHQFSGRVTPPGSSQAASSKPSSSESESGQNLCNQMQLWLSVKIV